LDQLPSRLVIETTDGQGRGESIEKRRGVLIRLGQLPEPAARREHRSDAVPRVQRPAEFAEDRWILAVELDQFFDLVAQQQQPEIFREQLPTETSEGLEKVFGSNLGQTNPDRFESLLGVEQRVGKIEMNLIRPICALKSGEFTARCSSCLSTEVLPILLVPSSHNQLRLP